MTGPQYNLTEELRTLLARTLPHRVMAKLASACGRSAEEILEVFSSRDLTASLAEIRRLWGARPPQPFTSWCDLVAQNLQRPINDFVHSGNKQVRKQLGGVLKNLAGETRMSDFFETRKAETRAREISNWCSEIDDYLLIARLQSDLNDQGAWNDLFAQRNSTLTGWFAGAPGIRHPFTKQFIKGPTQDSQKASIRSSAEDLAQDTWTYLATGIIPSAKLQDANAGSMARILLFDPRRATFHRFLQYQGSIVLLRCYAKYWPIWAIFVALMDLLPRFPDLENEAAVIESLPAGVVFDGEEEEDHKPSLGVFLKPVHELVGQHFSIAYSLGRPDHELVTWVLMDPLRYRPRFLVPEHGGVAFGELSPRLKDIFLAHFSKGSKAEPALIVSWWAPLGGMMEKSPDKTLLSQTNYDPDKLEVSVSHWSRKIRKATIAGLGKDWKDLFKLIHQMANEKRA